ncbi:MAG: hypothetical protein JRI96_10075 [Deltaproteobacteria bacterium]|nr:hypothetical protein [Deltaproteobacteria bacterium]
MSLRRLVKGGLRYHIESLWQHDIVQGLQVTQIGVTHQGKSHCERVDEHLGRLLTATKTKNKFRNIELYLLSAAAALHDIGKSHDINIKKLIKKMPINISQDHGLIAKYLLGWKVLGRILFPDRLYADAVADIVSVHDSGNMSLVDSGAIHLKVSPGSTRQEEARLQLLASVFRLADMMECSYERVLDLGDKINDREESKVVTGRRNLQVWELHPDYRECVYFSPICKDKTSLSIVYDEINNLNSQMTQEQICLLRSFNRHSSSRQKIGGCLPYRFLCTKDWLVRTSKDVFPVHRDIRGLMDNGYLNFYLEKSRKIINPIRLSYYGIDVSVTQSFFVVRYTLKGINLSHRPLRVLTHPIAGDTQVQAAKFRPKASTRFKRRAKWTQRKKGKMIWEDVDYKGIKLLHIALDEGVMPGEEFDIEVFYKWPDTVRKWNTLWWIDDLYTYGRTHKLEMKVRFSNMRLNQVSGFYVDTNSFVTAKIKEHCIKANSSKFNWSTKCPPDRSLFVFVCETEPKGSRSE